ncbi:MAG: hypothetical protein H5U00_11260 [Clostridia bacterium]|nr:hypothetical protein [Clostridia bacterium]
MVRRKRWWCSFLLSGVLLLLLPTVAGARLLVSSPEETLQSADLIITGTVMAREYGEAERRVTVEVDEVLKGDFRADELSLARQKNPVCGWAGFDFPAPGTQVFLLLCGEAEQGYRPARDLNYVAVVEGDRVTGLYRGFNVGINGRRWSREDYAAAYDAFYRSRRSLVEQSSPVEPAESGSSRAGERLAGPEEPRLEEKSFWARLGDFFRRLWRR